MPHTVTCGSVHGTALAAGKSLTMEDYWSPKQCAATKHTPQTMRGLGMWLQSACSKVTLLRARAGTAMASKSRDIHLNKSCSSTTI